MIIANEATRSSRKLWGGGGGGGGGGATSNPSEAQTFPSAWDGFDRPST